MPIRVGKGKKIMLAAFASRIDESGLVPRLPYPFWETEKGYEDFGGAGSLCHGWSAIPAYYLPRLTD